MNRAHRIAGSVSSHLTSSSLPVCAQRSSSQQVASCEPDRCSNPLFCLQLVAHVDSEQEHDVSLHGQLLFDAEKQSESDRASSRGSLQSTADASEASSRPISVFKNDGRSGILQVKLVCPQCRGVPREHQIGSPVSPGRQRHVGLQEFVCVLMHPCMTDACTILHFCRSPQREASPMKIQAVTTASILI